MKAQAYASKAFRENAKYFFTKCIREMLIGKHGSRRLVTEYDQANEVESRKALEMITKKLGGQKL